MKHQKASFSIISKNSSGTWPRRKMEQLVKPFWAIAAALPRINVWLLHQCLIAWEKSRQPVPVTLAAQVLGEQLLIRVSPALLQTRLAAVTYDANGIVSHDFRSQFIFEGDCSHLLSLTTQSRLDSEINQLFAAQMVWRETLAYEGLLKKLKEQGAFRHNNALMRDTLDIDRYFERYVRLAESIGCHGYKSRHELKSSYSKPMKRRWWVEAGEQEVGVAIGPAGEIWRFGGGYHRTAIARNLGLEAMPVRIRLVHGDWLLRCDAGKNSLYERLQSHLQLVGERSQYQK